MKGETVNLMIGLSVAALGLSMLVFVGIATYCALSTGCMASCT